MTQRKCNNVALICVCIYSDSRMKSPRSLPFLLLFLMLLAQQGAAVHALSHWQEDVQRAGQTERQQQPDSQPAPGHSCVTCLAFAVLGTALPVAGLALATASHFTFVPGTDVACRQARFLALYDSRAPPFTLA